MGEMNFILSHYFAVGLLALASYVFGRRLTGGVNYHSPLEQITFSIALGLGLIAYLVLFLGLIGLLYPLLLALTLLFGLVACYPVWFGWAGGLRNIWNRHRLI